MLTHPRYVIAVPNLARSVVYYRDVLGFNVQWQDVPGWRLFTRDSCVIMAGECPNAPPASEIGDHSYIAYVQVSRIDEFYADLVARGAEVIKALRDEPWGMREFGIKTADGHRMMFGEPHATG